MKNLKRVLPMLLVLVLVFALAAGTTAFAAGETVKIICPYGAVLRTWLPVSMPRLPTMFSPTTTSSLRT